MTLFGKKYQVFYLWYFIFLRKKKNSLERIWEAKDISKISKSEKSIYILNVIYKSTTPVFFLMLPDLYVNNSFTEKFQVIFFI